MSELLFVSELFRLFAVLALLIGDAAAGLARGLAGSLAFAASALFGALAEILRCDGFHVFHKSKTSDIDRFISRAFYHKEYIFVNRSFGEYGPGFFKLISFVVKGNNAFTHSF